MPRPKDEALEARRRRQILKAAKQVFAEQGFHQSSMRQIIDRCGLSTGAVYNYFPGKADIVRAICEDERFAIEFLLNRLHASDDPLRGLGQLVYDIVDSLTPEDARLTMEVFAESRRNEELRRLMEENDRKLQRGIVAAVRDGQKRGSIARFASAPAVAEIVMAVYEGFIGRMSSDASPQPRTAARLARRTVHTVLARARLCTARATVLPAHGFGDRSDTPIPRSGESEIQTLHPGAAIRPNG